MDSTTVYITLVVMLLGAFLIGLFFGAQYFGSPQSHSLKLHNEKTENRNTTKSSNNKDSSKDRLDMHDLQPGGIRATLTRDRAGSMTSKARMDIVESKLDFDRLGRCELRNADDFKKIVGIGPFVEEKLNEIGICSYQQLANMTEADMDAITTLIEFFPGRISRDDWRGQAAELMKS
ncbi:MAG: hypothetical protein NWQ09_09880 [Nonlabens sp.]|nr:hypothetical protein [Nonlabens sp.]